MRVKEEKELLKKQGNRNSKKTSKIKVRQLAHKIYLNRIDEGIEGNAESDWHKAEEALSQ